MSSCCHQQQPETLLLFSDRRSVESCNPKFQRPTSINSLWAGRDQLDGHAGKCNYRTSATKTYECCKNSSSFILMPERSTSRRISERSFLAPNPKCATYTARDNVCTYANSTKNNIQNNISKWMLLCIFLIGSVSSQTTVTNGCPNRCLCVFGEDNHQLMNILLEKERQIDAWERIKTKPDHINTYFCTRSDYSTVPKGLSAGVEALFLDGNDISMLESTDFIPNADDADIMSPIVVLSLANNSIHSIGNNVFTPLKDLKLLILRRNYLQDLLWTIGSTMNQRLIELDLSANNIKHFQTKDVGFYPVLKRLDLSGNKIVSVEGNIFTKFPELEHLDLSSNQIMSKGLSPSDSFVHTLTSLSVSNNDISINLFGGMRFFTRFPKLRSLDLSKNKFSKGVLSSKIFEGLHHLTLLNLSSCGIKNIEQGWINGGPEKNIEILDLSHNFLSTISPHSLSVVFTLDLNVTPAHAVTKQSFTIDGAMADFMEIPEENVETHWLRPLTSLKILRLNGNRHLSRIEDNTFDYMPNLQYLFLQNCAVRRLNIASVRYRYGVMPISRTLPELTHIWIHGNPLECDCYIRFLKEWSVTAVIEDGNTTVQKHIDSSSYNINTVTKSVDAELAVCISPVNMAGLAVVNAQGKGMTCQDEPYSIFIAVLIGPMTFAGSVLLTMICGSFHVCFVKMKKGAVLSYHAREEMMRNPKVRGRRRNAPPNIFSSFGWNAPLPQDDISTYSPGNRSGRYTNLVLGQLGEHRSSHPTVSAGILSHAMAIGHSTTSLTVEDAPNKSKMIGDHEQDEKRKRERSAAPLLYVENVRDAEVKNTDHGSERRNVPTKKASRGIPFIDEKVNHNSPQNGENLRRCSSSEESERRQLIPDKREHSLTTLSSNDSDNNFGSSSNSSIQSPISIHAIPDPSGSSHGSSEEVCL